MKLSRKLPGGIELRQAALRGTSRIAFLCDPKLLQTIGRPDVAYWAPKGHADYL